MVFFLRIVYEVLTIRLFLNKYNIFQYTVGHMHSGKQLRVAAYGMRALDCVVQTSFLK